MSAQEILDRLTRASERHRPCLDAESAKRTLGSELHAAGDAVVAIVELVRILAQQLDEFLAVRSGKIGLDAEHERCAAGQLRNRRVVLQRIADRQRMRRDGERRVPHGCERVAVRLRLRQLRDANCATGAGFVDDHHLGAENRLHQFGQHARDDVDAASGRRWNDQLDRARGKFLLRVNGRARERQRGSEYGDQHSTAWHVDLLACGSCNVTSSGASRLPGQSTVQSTVGSGAAAMRSIDSPCCVDRSRHCIL